MADVWKTRWFALHEYERTAMAVILAAGSDGYECPATAPLTAGACDRLVEMGYARLYEGRLFLDADRTRGFMRNLLPLAETWRFMQEKRASAPMVALAGRQN